MLILECDFFYGFYVILKVLVLINSRFYVVIVCDVGMEIVINC